MRLFACLMSSLLFWLALSVPVTTLANAMVFHEEEGHLIRWNLDGSKTLQITVETSQGNTPAAMPMSLRCRRGKAIPRPHEPDNRLQRIAADRLDKQPLGQPVLGKRSGYPKRVGEHVIDLAARDQLDEAYDLLETMGVFPGSGYLTPDACDIIINREELIALWVKSGGKASGGAGSGASPGSASPSSGTPPGEEPPDDKRNSDNGKKTFKNQEKLDEHYNNHRWKHGNIATLFKPDRGIDYYLQEIKK